MTEFGVDRGKGSRSVLVSLEEEGDARGGHATQ